MIASLLFLHAAAPHPQSLHSLCRSWQLPTQRIAARQPTRISQQCSLHECICCPCSMHPQSLCYVSVLAVEHPFGTQTTPLSLLHTSFSAGACACNSLQLKLLLRQLGETQELRQMQEGRPDWACMPIGAGVLPKLPPLSAAGGACECCRGRAVPRRLPHQLHGGEAGGMEGSGGTAGGCKTIAVDGHGGAPARVAPAPVVVGMALPSWRGAASPSPACPWPAG